MLLMVPQAWRIVSLIFFLSLLCLSLLCGGGRKIIDGGLTNSFFREVKSLMLHTMVRLGFKRKDITRIDLVSFLAYVEMMMLV